MPPRTLVRLWPTPVPTASAPQLCKSCLRRAFASTPALPTRLRQRLFAWLQGPGEVFRHPLVNTTNYLSAYDRQGNLLRQRGEANKTTSAGDAESPESDATKALDAAADASRLQPVDQDDLRPFPLNRHFFSQSILSEELQEEIWKRVRVDGKSVRQVSVEMALDMRRVAAVVRLVEVEKRMRAEGQELALPYAKAIYGMVPVNTLNPATRKPSQPHESINDLEQHPLTFPQLFYPTSESRAFNRTDAGRVFSGAPRLPDDQDVGQGGTPALEPWQDTKAEYVGKPGHARQVLKPADSRIPHPHLIAFEKDKATLPPWQRQERYNDRLKEEDEKRLLLKERRAREEEKDRTRIDTERWEFVLTNVTATPNDSSVGGRGAQSLGHRYGVPSQDRKKGQVKIPTEVVV